ncbi:unnamed protein product [Aureobasidium uvarum]|uniref:Uncharacterized protein n=1 Tax=Aureobasidium uvarum TaxID=2773716 RepID=A0A9N8PUL0_9PEZI|nr:unnamed protein product [Aureobasidium uvarum]
MTGSIQGSAIDDGFKTLTNAPDAWVTGRYAVPPPVDYQHYVEPGDTRSAVDDRCFTEYGAVENAHYDNKTTKPAKLEQKRHRSRQTSTNPASRGKRRPSPSFRIRSKDGDSLVVSNPFVLRKPSRPRPRPESEQSSQTDDQSQYSSTTTARSRAFQIRIRGKNGEEAVHEIKRPLHFASQSQGTTLVGGESGREDLKYWSANQSSSSHKRDREHNSKCMHYPTRPHEYSTDKPTIAGLATFTDFVVDSTTVASSTAGSPVRMSGALPNSSPAPSTDTLRSRLLPPEKPVSSMHDSVISVSSYPSKSPSRSISDNSKVSSSKRSALNSPHNEVIVVPDESLDGSVDSPFTSLSTRCIVSSRPASPTSVAELTEGNDAASISDLITSQGSSVKITDKASSSASSTPPSTSSRMSSKRVVTLTESSVQAQDALDDSRPATVSLSKHKETKQEAYYNWKVPKDSLYSISTKDSKSSLHRHESVAREKTVSRSSRHISQSDGATQHNADAASCVPSLARPESRQTLPQGYQPPPRSLSTQSSSARDITDGWVQETAHCIPLPSSRSASSKSNTRPSSSTSNRQSTRVASQDSAQDDQDWNKPLSATVASGQTTSKHSRRSYTDRMGQEAGAWEEAAAWEEPLSSANRSKTSRTSKSHQSQSRKSISAHQSANQNTANQNTEEADNEQGSWAGYEEGSRKSVRSISAINIEEDLLHYLPPLSDNKRLPPPMPMLTTIYEVSEPTPSNHSPSMFTQETTHFARPGAISPHPLSSVSSAATARKPPTIEPHRLEYQKPYVESKSSSSASSGAHDSSRLSRRSSRPRMLEQRAPHSSKEADRSRSSREVSSGSAQSSRKSRASTKASGGGWKFW